MNIENNDSMVASLLRMFKNIYYACRRVIIIALHGNSRAVDSIIYIRNGEIKLSGTVYGSVGYDYKIVYPEDAFFVTEKFRYTSPELMKEGMCGGDEAIVEYTLEPRKRGLFRVYEELYFRGKLENRVLHHYWAV